MDIPYCLHCNRCDLYSDEVYIGMTDRILFMQCSEHRQQLINRKIEDSAVVVHASGNYHNIDWKDSIILDHEEDLIKIRLKKLCSYRGTTSSTKMLVWQWP